MRCRQCDYSLWTIQGRTCPECGAPFKPSDYQFQRGSVAFRCPHCSQDYYGTSPEGHLEPRAFDCVRCGKHISMDEMVLEPAEGMGTADDRTTALRNPWLDRAAIGRVRAWFQSVGKVLGDPNGFAGSLRPGAPNADAWKFFGVCLGVQVILSMICAAPGAIIFLTGGMGAAPPMPKSLIVWSFVWPAVEPIIYHVAIVFLGAAVMHLLLLMLRTASYPFSRTLQLALYAEGGVTVLAAIPCVNIIARLWWAVIVAFLLGRGQRCHPGIGAVAAVPIIILAFVLSIVMGVAPMMGVLGPAGVMRTWTMSSTTSSTVGGTNPASGFGANLATAAADGAATPLDALADGDITGEGLMHVVAPEGSGAGIGGLAFGEVLVGAGSELVRAEAARMAARLPPSPAPFRVGQAIFCYRGVPASATQIAGGVVTSPWLAISISRDPAGSVTTYAAGGERTFPRSQLASELVLENARRATVGLPAIPDPATMPDIYSGIVPPDLPANGAASGSE